MPSAKQQALKDIKTALKKEGRCFLAFRRELNTPIKEIVKDYLNKQKELK